MTALSQLKNLVLKHGAGYAMQEDILARKRRKNGLDEPLTDIQHAVQLALENLFDNYAEAMPHISKKVQRADGSKEEQPVFYVSSGLFPTRLSVYDSLMAQGTLPEGVSVSTFYECWNR